MADFRELTEIGFADSVLFGKKANSLPLFRLRR